MKNLPSSRHTTLDLVSMPSLNGFDHLEHLLLLGTEIVLSAGFPLPFPFDLLPHDALCFAHRSLGRLSLEPPQRRFPGQGGEHVLRLAVHLCRRGWGSRRAISQRDGIVSPVSSGPLGASTLLSHFRRKGRDCVLLMSLRLRSSAKAQLDLLPRAPLDRGFLLFLLPPSFFSLLLPLLLLLLLPPLRPLHLLLDHRPLPILVPAIHPLLPPHRILPPQRLGAIVHPPDMQPLLRLLDPAHPFAAQVPREFRQARPPRRVHVHVLLVRNVLLVEVVQVHALLPVRRPQQLDEVPLELRAVPRDVPPRVLADQ